MNYELRTKKAFTLIELVVAVAILAMVLSFASVIFRVSIEAYRTAGANTEIMQKLRAVTDQLNADFKGQIWNPPGRIRFGFDNSDIDGKTVTVRSDSIVFFANGDFQSTGQYKDNISGKDKTVVGNVACIFYGLAANPDPNTNEPKEKILVRRQTIITADSDWQESKLEDVGEYCTDKSLADLIADQVAYPDGNTPEMKALVKRPDLNPDEPNDLVMYMVKGVDDFTIQYVGWEENPPKIKEFNEWRPENEDVNSWPERLGPLALKFTFTLYDSKGIIENGRRFTHIVYVGN